MDKCQSYFFLIAPEVGLRRVLTDPNSRAPGGPGRPGMQAGQGGPGGPGMQAGPGGPGVPYINRVSQDRNMPPGPLHRQTEANPGSYVVQYGLGAVGKYFRSSKPEKK